ncbi:hypothetical protein [Marinactinospora rubrisoli]|uniref:Uncharacterized protein n=1 Tax=Marinactinospora rubrisoli TaxID=2715399 RepID=A0ABW2KBS6_9ACTN
MADEESATPGRTGPPDIRQRFQELKTRHGDTERMWRAVEAELEMRVNRAAGLYARGLQAAEGEREAEAQQFFADAGRWVRGVTDLLASQARGRFPGLMFEAGVVSGRSALQRDDLHEAYDGFSNAYLIARQLRGDERGPMHDTVRRADFARLQERLLERAAGETDPKSADGMLVLAAQIESDLREHQDPRRMREIQLQRLGRQMEILDTNAASDEESVRAHRSAAIETATTILGAQPLDKAGPELRPVAYTYARLLRQFFADGGYSKADAAYAVGNLRQVHTYLKLGDPDGIQGMDTRESLLALRDADRASLAMLPAPGTEDWNDLKMDKKREVDQQRLELLKEIVAVGTHLAGSERDKNDEAQRAADAFELFSAVAQSGPEQWPYARTRLSKLPERLTEAFGIGDDRVAAAASSLAALQFADGRTKMAEGQPRAALEAVKKAVDHQQYAVRSLLARGADVTEAQRTLATMRRVQGQAAVGGPDMGSPITAMDALRAKRAAAGAPLDRGVVAALARPNAPAPSSTAPVRDARAAIRRAFRMS